MRQLRATSHQFADARCNSSGSLAMLAAMRRASSRVSTILRARRKNATLQGTITFRHGGNDEAARVYRAS